MPLELGQSNEPRALIEGVPEALEEQASTLKTYAEHLDGIGAELKRVDVPGWKSKASDAFMDMFSKEPPKWFKSCDALVDVADSLMRYAAVLRSAHARAGEAIALWEQAEAASGTTIAGQPGAPSSGPAADAGEKLRLEAREILRRARDEVQDAGDEIATQTDRALDGLIEAVTAGWKAEGKAEAQGLGAGFEAAGPKDGKLGELKAFAQLGKASAEGSIGNELFKLNGKAEASAAAETTLAAALTDEGLKARAEAQIGGKATAEGRIDAGLLGANAKGEAFAGGVAGAQVSAGPQGFNAKAEAFAGAKITGKTGADVGGLGVNLTAEGWAGAGAEAGVTFGEDENGVWKVGANAGAAEVLGGKLGFEVTVDAAKVTKTVQDAADVVGVVGDAAESTGRTISGWLD